MPLTAAMIAAIDARHPLLDESRRGAELAREPSDAPRAQAGANDRGECR
jgi:hypothetical protein